MKKICLASHNAGKLRELRALLAPLGIELTSMGELNLPEADEPYSTFLENALTKARHASRLSGLPALADDSGLCVDALQGAPGVFSARFAGEPRSDARNNRHLLQQLETYDMRQAHYTCVLVLVRHAEDPDPVVTQGRWQGEILRAPRGDGGFGYDPLFWLASYGCSVAELDAKIKNQISHRAIAVQRLLQGLV